jgi:hypothetical protein
MRGNPLLRFEATKGGHAKQAKKRDTLDKVLDKVPRLDSPEAAKLRLEAISNAAMHGLLAGSQAGAAVRACEAWLKAHELELDMDRLAVLEKEVTRLERELKAARGRD